MNVRSYKSPDGMTWFGHIDGVPWHDAPLPRRLHRCWPQTRVWINSERVERCPCGAMQIDGLGWTRRNETRKARRAARDTP